MSTVQTGVITTRIPTRLDRLPWSRFHWMVILGLGTAWILDGLEVTIVGSIASRLTESGSGISITAAQIGIAGSVYVAGACSGALFFGQMTDKYGRKKLFLWTLGLYLVATAATGGSFNVWYFYIARFFTGAGIGGEYAAINSAIDELIPARTRGRVDLVINGSYWIGSAAGSAASIAFLNTAWLPKDIGWRLGFALGVIVAIAVLFVRRGVPESPRWMFIHGYDEEAEALVDDIERGIAEETGVGLEAVDREITVRQRLRIPFREIGKVAYRTYPRRSLLALALFVGQAFIYNGITFNLGTLMSSFFKVSSSVVPVFVILYAIANFLGPLTIGRLFDTVGRKPMISGTYIGSAALGVVLAALFTGGAFNRWTFIAVVMATFFLASAGASAAYLTASEIFPMETRALAIAFFYAIGTAVGGIAGPLLFGSLIQSGVRGHVAVAFYIGSGVMALGGVTEIFWGVRAEQTQLEDIAAPLTAEDARSGPDRPSEAGEEATSGRDEEATSGRDEETAEARRARADAALARADADDHRASMHELLARAARGDGEAARRAEFEGILAQMADLAARAADEEAAAAEHDTRAARAEGADADAEREHAQAARDRAQAWRRDAEALGAGEGDAANLRHLAEASRERARAHEQAAETRDGRPAGDESGDVAAAEADMHGAWQKVHAARAALEEARSGADVAAQEEARREADALTEAALAAESRLVAAQHRADADRERTAADSVAAAARREEDRRRREAELDRLRARLARDRGRQAGGLRRFRPGPGRQLGGSPAISAPPPPRGEALDHEIESLARALAEHGPASRSELRDMVGARYWGPGAFGEALDIAIHDGDIRRVGRSTYALPEPGDRDGNRE